MKRRLTVMVLAVMFILPIPAQVAIPPAPPETRADYGFAAMNEATMKALLAQGTLIVVRQRPNMSLINVTAGQIVNAPINLVWATITDFASYPKFMPQTAAMKIIERDGPNRMLIEQTIAVKIWRLPSVDTTYQLAQELTPNKKMRFYWVAGDLRGTYGGWDFVPVGNQTMIFYTLFSNLTAMGWGLGSVFQSEPDFMAGINVTTALMVVKAVKVECERRAPR